MTKSDRNVSFTYDISVDHDFSEALVRMQNVLCKIEGGWINLLV